MTPRVARSSPLGPSEALEVVHRIDHADLDPSASDADGPHNEAHLAIAVTLSIAARSGHDMTSLNAAF